MKPQYRSAWAIFALTTIVGLYAYFQVSPDAQIPIHWNGEGEVDGYGSPVVGFFMMPFMQLVVLAIFGSLKFLEPRAKNLETSRKAIHAVATSVTALLFVVQLVIVDQVFGFGFIGIKAMFVGVGVMLMIMGNYFGKLKSSFFIGIRTPWTLSSETVWQKTHRMGGKLFVAAGFILALSALVLDSELMPFVIVATALPASLIPVAYSWYLWHKERHKV